MSMHLRGSRDMMGNDEDGWWKSRTGLEQKLIILCSLLFILSFALVISVIVINNRPKAGSECFTTIAPTPPGTTVSGEEPSSTASIAPTVTGEPETTPSEGTTSSSEPASTEPATSPTTESTIAPAESTTAPAESTTAPAESTTPQPPETTTTKKP